MQTTVKINNYSKILQPQAPQGNKEATDKVVVNVHGESNEPGIRVILQLNNQDPANVPEDKYGVGQLVTVTF